MPDALAVELGLTGFFRRVYGSGGLYRLRQRAVAVLLLYLYVVEGKVISDAEEPSQERDSSRLVAVDSFEGVEESLGGEVFRQLGVVYQVVSVAVDLEDVLFVETAEGFAVALGRLGNESRFIGLEKVRPSHDPPL